MIHVSSTDLYKLKCFILAIKNVTFKKILKSNDILAGKFTKFHITIHNTHIAIYYQLKVFCVIIYYLIQNYKVNLTFLCLTTLYGQFSYNHNELSFSNNIVDPLPRCTPLTVF